MISLLISIVVLFVVIAILVWLCRYLGFPDIVEKVLIAIGVLVLLILVLNFFGYGGVPRRL